MRVALSQGHLAFQRGRHIFFHAMHIVGGSDRIRRRLETRKFRGLRSMIYRALSALQRALDVAFPLHPPDSPPPPMPITSAAALREGALLSENIRAVAEEGEKAA
ncbi:MAG: hypothetical protein ACLQE9_14185 [Roseiarcus sp.]